MGPEHVSDSTNDPCAVLNPSTATMKLPVPVIPDSTALRVLEEHEPQLSQNASCSNIASEYKRKTVSRELPQVLSV
jgi:hypothetical protein